jgi:hypothetical protein
MMISSLLAGLVGEEGSTTTRCGHWPPLPPKLELQMKAPFPANLATNPSKKEIEVCVEPPKFTVLL